MAPNTRADFYAMIDVRGPDECHPWKGKLVNGYGGMRLDGVRRLAQSWLSEFEIGPVPFDLNGRRRPVDHLCHTTACAVPVSQCPHRACCNALHLRLSTQQQNILRGNGVAARNAAKTHCPRGHLYDEGNTRWYRDMRYCRTCQHEARHRSPSIVSE